MDTPSPPSSPLAPAQLFTVGADLLAQVQRIIGTDRVRSLRVKLGGRTVSEIPIAPLSAVATALLVALAVVVSTLSVEVQHEPSGPDKEASH